MASCGSCADLLLRTELEGINLAVCRLDWAVGVMSGMGLFGTAREAHTGMLQPDLKIRILALTSMKMMAILVLALVPCVAHAQVFSGPVQAIDGDTLRGTEGSIRLYGIDAVEANQTCNRSGVVWQCGKDAKALLTKLVSDDPVFCEQRDIDADGRIVAVCKAGDSDLGRTMVEAGFAIALRSVDDAYSDSEARVRGFRVGIWSSRFEVPTAYRAAHPEVLTAPQRTGISKSIRRNRPVSTRIRGAGVYFRGCAEAWAAGAAPIFRGQPGYRADMDGDGDGIACEPHRH